MGCPITITLYSNRPDLSVTSNFLGQNNVENMSMEILRILLGYMCH